MWWRIRCQACKKSEGSWRCLLPKQIQQQSILPTRRRKGAPTANCRHWRKRRERSLWKRRVMEAYSDPLCLSKERICLWIIQLPARLHGGKRRWTTTLTCRPPTRYHTWFGRSARVLRRSQFHSTLRSILHRIGWKSSWFFARNFEFRADSDFREQSRQHITRILLDVRTRRYWDPRFRSLPSEH